MKTFLNKLFKGDRYIWSIYFTLGIISIVEIFSATSTLAYRSNEHWAPMISHTSSFIIGTIIVLIVQNFRTQIFRPLGLLAIFISFVTLIAVLFTPEVNGAQRNIMSLQPSEIGKFGLIATVSYLLSKGRTEYGITKYAFWAIIISSIFICGLILPENFSTAVLLGSVVFFLMFIAKVQWKYLLSLLGTVLIAGTILTLILVYVPEDYMIGRMKTWKARLELSFNGDKTPLVEQEVNDKNRQVQYGRMAVANGLVGKGPGNSQIRDFLPQAYSDYIYSIIIEELGFVFGGIGILLLYIFLMYRVGKIFKKCKYPFPGFLLLGLTMLIIFQALINMAVGVDLIPVTGQPLPLISRGKNSMFMTCLYFGIILSISRSVGMGQEDYDDEHVVGEPMKQIDQNISEESLSDESVIESEIEEIYEK